MTELLCRVRPFQSEWTPIKHLNAASLPGLDGLRAFAVVRVISGHLFTHHLLIPLALGVQVFLVLTGFLVTHLLTQQIDRSGTIRLKRFYRNRLWRILPPHYVYLAVLLAIPALSSEYPLLYVLSSVTYLLNYYIAPYGNFGEGMYHLWSLALDQQFYFVWPILLLWQGRNRNRLLFLIAALFSACCVYRLSVFIGAGAVRQLYFTLENRIADFMAGAFVAAWMRIDPRVPAWLLTRSTAICLLGWLAATATIVTRDDRMRAVALTHGLDSIAIAVLMLQVIHHAPAVLDCGVVKQVGRMSYSLYLYHPIALWSANTLGARYGFKWRYSVILAYVFAAILGWFAYRAIEQPLERWRKREKCVNQPNAVRAAAA